MQIDYTDVDSTDEQVYLRQRVTRADLNSNQYNLTVWVPQEIDRDFKASVILTHPFTKFRRVLPVTFKMEPTKAQKQTRREEPATVAAEYEDMPVRGKQASQQEVQSSGGLSLTNFVVIIILIVCSVLFIKNNFSQFKPPNQVRPKRSLICVFLEELSTSQPEPATSWLAETG